MSLTLRIVLIVISIGVIVFVFKKIRKSDFFIEDSFFWIIFCLSLLIISVFPKICYTFSDWLGFESPSNFVFLAIIFLLIAKIFFMSTKISKLQAKLNNLIQKYALDSQKLLNLNQQDQKRG